jgi:hypothetical protein
MRRFMPDKKEEDVYIIEKVEEVDVTTEKKN